MKKPQNGLRGRPDFLLLIFTLLLVGFGLVMVLSASSNIAVASDLYNRDPLYFTKRQLLWVGLGSIAMLTLMNIPYEIFKKWFIIYFLPVLVLLMLVPFVGKEVNGARSWFGVGSLGIQPTEFAKLALILYLGRLISKKGETFRDFKKGLLPVMIVVGFICGLIMLQPDLGSCLILAACAAIMIVAGGSNLKHVLYSGAIISVIVSLMVSISMASNPGAWQYRINRFTSFMNPLEDQLGSGYHLAHSLFALGHGGFTGAGFGHGVQKLHYLPYAYNDFIFAVIGEELGFIGSMIFLLVYLFFLWRGIIIALRCPDVYGTVVGVGIVGLIAVQAIINIGGVTGLMPITGVTLPFISYGGSSMLVTLASIGILLSISREYNNPERSNDRYKKTAR
ncbi:putative lipid II flippase FtsW [Paenibacillus abyssi]|uniref:Stage V sporulation protein E n=1 Tax=Paenibacillus abyssi TaxID=1340531 RepID=A0A917D6X8_9BACL|nr:putative lipid II flippase FtsW [Paenibacillus abyssi]GGG13105.1 stage V sporulation protein E [Paenibacillus abyssi]